MTTRENDRADFDPAKVVPRPAATVMLVEDRPDLQVLMIERHAKMAFAGGMWVFPGGAVDEGEADDFEPHCEGLDDAQASELLGVEHGGLAYWVAAIRENFEEAGLMLARKHDGERLDSTEFRSCRRELHAGDASFLDVVLRHDLLLDTSTMHYTARWITPRGGRRRFDARFFVTTPPDGQEVTHDEVETVGWRWVPPREALERFARKEMVMMSPTVRMLRCLDRFDSARSIIEAASANLSDERARVRYDADGRSSIVLPGERGYEAADEEKENGWVRLRPLP